MINNTTASPKTTASKTMTTTLKRQVPASTTTPRTVVRQSPSSESTHENRLQAALEHARRLTQMYGCQSVDAAIAWETVEELRTSGRKKFLPSSSSCQASFDVYCAENPHALECRSYDC